MNGVHGVSGRNVRSLAGKEAGLEIARAQQKNDVPGTYWTPDFAKTRNVLITGIGVRGVIVRLHVKVEIRLGCLGAFIAFENN